MADSELVVALALAVREAVLPLLGSHAARAQADAPAAGGDITFEIDRRAEDVVAERGGGLTGPPVRLSRNDDLERMFWTYGFRGRPARATVEVIGDLVDASSVAGATFELGSAAFDMTRVVTGQLDCYVEPGPRLVADVPGMEDEFRRVGRGAILNNSPYDLAAAALCATEAGAIVTDASGRPLDDRPLLGSGRDFQMSVVVSANRALHDKVLGAIDRGIDRLKALRA